MEGPCGGLRIPIALRRAFVNQLTEPNGQDKSRLIPVERVCPATVGLRETAIGERRTWQQCLAIGNSARSFRRTRGDRKPIVSLAPLQAKEAGIHGRMRSEYPREELAGRRFRSVIQEPCESERLNAGRHRTGAADG